MVFELDHSFPCGTSIEEMCQIEDIQAGEAVLNAYMGAYIFVFLYMLEPIEKESAVKSKRIVSRFIPSSEYLPLNVFY